MRQKQSIFSLFLLSPSSRRAWIEIKASGYKKSGEKVALLAEGVDRNAVHQLFATVFGVALLAEGVDRNQ